MPFTKTPISDLLLFEPIIWRDERGYFFESFNLHFFNKNGISRPFIQDNQAYSRKGVLRGLHYQVAPYSQAKLVRVLQGEVLDVVVDIRPDSNTYGQSFSVLLNDQNMRQLYVPRGFAHGYVVLSEEAIFFYKVDNVYKKDAEAGIVYNDSHLNIDWMIDNSKAILSSKDKVLPSFGQHRPYLANGIVKP